ncbi:MAG: TetM/TetW/TetO/TetS family tetracycline resistance ribosomal protection protein, partial [Hamadaea sp.]|nr:TetM/TetW/TetO/TetS family tetracycline resistance ribosomal protection protein [Hamadaea sp.]
GADPDRVTAAIAAKLSADLVPVTVVRDAGGQDASVADADPHRWLDVLSAHDDRLLSAYLQGKMSDRRLTRSLNALARAGRVFPVLAGSAITGTGVTELLQRLPQLLPSVVRDADAPVAGSVFKVERGPAGERVALAHLSSGTVRVRDRIRLAGREQKVTGLSVYDNGTAKPEQVVTAGRIARLTGLAEVRIGDPIGDAATDDTHHFAPPSLETAVVARDPRRKGALHLALAQLAEQDPLIDLRQDDARGELFLSLYGEVQKEVIQTTLAEEYGVEVEFRETTTICVERPVGVGEAVELLGENPFLAGLGLRVAPLPVGSGVRVRLDVAVETMPLYVYKAVDEFRRGLDEYVRDVLRQGLAGWQVVDCLVTVTHSDYSPPGTSARDFRLLTPLVLMAALDRAGTVVCEPIHRFRIEAPADTAAGVSQLLARSRGVVRTQEIVGELCVLEGEVPADRMHRVQQRLGGLTRGEGVAEFAFDHHAPVRGPRPVRARSGADPLNRKEYLLLLSGRV